MGTLDKKYDAIVHGYVCADVVHFKTKLEEGGIAVGRAVMPSIIGGVCGNTGLALAKLGRRVLVAGKVGDDERQFEPAEYFRRRGIDHNFVAMPKMMTSISSIEIDTQTGERSIKHEPGANEAICSFDIDGLPLRQARHYHYGYFGLVKEVNIPDLLRRARAAGLTTSFDTHGNPTIADRRYFEECARYTDVLFPSIKEIKAITGIEDPGEICRYLASLGPRLAGVKLGERGSIGIMNGTMVNIPAFKVKSVSTLGAGDSFYAGVIHGFLDNLGLEGLLRLGNAVGASRAEVIMPDSMSLARIKRIMLS